MNSKRKGSRWERECAVLLSLMVDKDNKRIFWRTAGSGNFSTINRLQIQSGDLCIIDDRYKCDLVIECKNISNVSIYPLSSKLEKIIHNLIKLYGKEWILMLRITNKGMYIISPYILFNDNLSCVIKTGNTELYTYLINDALFGKLSNPKIGRK